MKKNLLLLWGMTLFLAFSVGCSSDNEGGKNHLEENYFTIESAVFHDGDLPVGNHSLIYDLNINSNVITGGSTLISFASELELSKAFIGVEGMKGYYEYNLLATKANSATYKYEILLLISQNVTDKDFGITLSVEAINGELSQEEVADVDVIEAGAGDLQISLSWDQLDDLDLHVIDPLGNHIYFNNPYKITEDIDEDDLEFYFDCYLVEKYTGNKTSHLNPDSEEDRAFLQSFWGEVWSQIDWLTEQAEFREFLTKNYTVESFLDIDSNASCSIDAVNNENIYFNNPVNGEYKIYVDLWKKCNNSTAGAKYSVTVNYKGNVVKISDKQIGQFANNYQGSENTERVYIGSFTVGGSRSSSPAVAEQLVEKELSKLKQRLFAK